MDFENTCGRVAPVFLEYEALLKAFIGKRVRDKDQTQEISHQVLLKLYQNCEQLPQVRHLKAWLYQITRHAVYDYFRENQKHTYLETEPEITEDLDDHLQKELQEYIAPMIRLLPPAYAEPLRLSDLEGLPQQQIAAQLGLSLSGAKSRIQRGREKLRALFSECCHLELDRQGHPIGAIIREDCASLQPLRESLAHGQQEK
jgi:RNA polymerase sigma-70 factor, ECF subfamily